LENIVNGYMQKNVSELILDMDLAIEKKRTSTARKRKVTTGTEKKRKKGRRPENLHNS